VERKKHAPTEKRRYREEIMKSRFDKIRKQINSRSIRPFARSLPWPYNGMVNDILGSIQTGGNYLAALGLASYTEVCGRQIFYSGKPGEDWKCYNDFLKYMGAGEVLNKKILFKNKKVYFKDAVRNGLVHHYFMKIGSGAVAMNSSKRDAIRTGFLANEPNEIIMVVIPYFNLFCSALKKAKLEGKLKW
jgi:hypothetical protein